MGHVDSEVYLASPAVAAASAVAGKIICPASWINGKEERAMKACGHVFKYGDNVDTDVIIPARYLNATQGEELAKHCMEDIDKEFVHKVAEGRYHCGQQELWLRLLQGARAIGHQVRGCKLCDRGDLARIFYRNAINIGLPIIECPEAAKAIENGGRGGS